MKRLILKSDTARRLPFYLAMEEWAALTLPPDEYFFCWVVEPTVIIGRNQDIGCELDRDYCRRNGIEVCRRRSGGGCVYADRHNIMMSYISPATEVSTTFAAYAARVADMLGALGLAARPSGRNDVEIDGRKVSGNAFYHLPGRSIVHGTLLYDFDPGRMMQAITPSRSKLESRQVQSVAARVTTIRQHLDISMDRLLDHIYATMCDGGSIELTDNDIAAISALEQPYYDPAWIEGRHQQRSVSRRIDRVGELSLSLRTDSNGLISDISLGGDFFGTPDTDTELQRLTGTPADQARLAAAIDDIDTGRIACGLTKHDFLKLLLDTL